MLRTIPYLVGAALLTAAAGCGKSELAETGSDPARAEAKQASYEQPAAQPVPAPRRDVVRKAKLEILVDSAKEAETTIIRAVESAGGYVESSAAEAQAEGRPVVQLTLRVPAARFQTILERLESLGVVLSKSTSAEDVTAQLVDLRARVRTMRASEEALRTMLQRRTNLSEVIALEERLTQVRTNIESIEAQLKATGELAALSTVDVLLRQRAPVVASAADPNWAREAWSSATQSMAAAGRSAFSVAAWIVVWSPFWLPILLGVRYLAGKSRSRRTAPDLAGPGFQA